MLMQQKYLVLRFTSKLLMFLYNMIVNWFLCVGYNHRISLSSMPICAGSEVGNYVAYEEAIISNSKRPVWQGIQAS